MKSITVFILFFLLITLSIFGQGTVYTPSAVYQVTYPASSSGGSNSTTLIAGSGVTLVTNAANNFTISASGASFDTNAYANSLFRLVDTNAYANSLFRRADTNAFAAAFELNLNGFTTNETVYPSSVNNTPLTIVGLPNQVSNPFQIFSNNTKIFIVGADGTVTGNGAGLTNVTHDIIQGGSGTSIAQQATGASEYVSLGIPGMAGATSLNPAKFRLPYACTYTNLQISNDTGFGIGTNVVVTLFTNGVASNMQITWNGAGTAAAVSVSNLTTGVSVPANCYMHINFSNNSASAPANQLLNWNIEAFR